MLIEISEEHWWSLSWAERMALTGFPVKRPLDPSELCRPNESLLPMPIIEGKSEGAVYGCQRPHKPK